MVEARVGSPLNSKANFGEDAIFVFRVCIPLIDMGSCKLWDSNNSRGEALSMTAFRTLNKAKNLSGSNERSH